MYMIISPENRYNFTSFPILKAFISVSCLIALAETFNTILNRSDKHFWNGQPYLVPDFTAGLEHNKLSKKKKNASIAVDLGICLSFSLFQNMIIPFFSSFRQQ